MRRARPAAWVGIVHENRDVYGEVDSNKRERERERRWLHHSQASLQDAEFSYILVCDELQYQFEL